MYKKNLVLISLIWIAASLSASAQSPILSKFVQKIRHSQKLSYVSVTNNESPFGDNADTITVYQDNHKKGWQFAAQSRQIREAYLDSSLLQINLPEKYYSVYKDYRFSKMYANSSPLFKLLEVIDKTPAVNINTLADTIIGKVSCHHIRISKMDMDIRGKRAYDIYDLYLNQKDLLPVYSENRIQGYIEKGGTSSEDVFRLTNRNTYFDYRINPKHFPDIAGIKAPAGFITLEQFNNKSNQPVQARLSAGEKAPEWSLENLDGKILTSENVKNKVVLIDFFGSYCAPCIFSIPMIKRLHEKYKNAGVELVSVNVDPGKDSALKFASKYNITYPSYIKGKSVADLFHVAPIPTFYLVDKQGKIVFSADGYSDDLEKKLVSEIDKVL